MDYERGLATFKQLGQGTDWYTEILPHESALLDRLHDERLYGTAPQTHQEMMRAVDQLNRLSFKHLGISFIDLCLGRQVQRRAQPPQQEVTGTGEHEPQKDSKSFSNTSSVDVGIVITLEEEFTGLHNEIAKQCVPVLNQETGSYYYPFTRASADSTHYCQCVATFAGEMGPVKAGLVTQRFIRQWKPRTLVMLGIAAALSHDVRLGDVIVASQVDAYLENSKAVQTTDHDGYTFTFGGEVYRSSTYLLNLALNFKFVHQKVFLDWQAHCARELRRLLPEQSLRDLIQNGMLQDHVEMTRGHLASGPVVGASKAFTDWLKSRDRKYLALEMESAGLMAAVYEQADPKHTLVLRAISDYGDERKEELDKVEQGAIRCYAMHNAIQLLWRFFDAGILPP